MASEEVATSRVDADDDDDDDDDQASASRTAESCQWALERKINYLSPLLLNVGENLIASCFAARPLANLLQSPTPLGRAPR